MVSLSFTPRPSPPAWLCSVSYQSSCLSPATTPSLLLLHLLCFCSSTTLYKPPRHHTLTTRLLIKLWLMTLRITITHQFTCITVSLRSLALSPVTKKANTDQWVSIDYLPVISNGVCFFLSFLVVLLLNSQSQEVHILHIEFTVQLSCLNLWNNKKIGGGKKTGKFLLIPNIL